MQVELSTVTKIISSICGIIIVIMSITRFTSLNLADPRGFILTIHFILLGLILVLAEFKINYVIRNFGLVKGLFGRGVYALFLGTIMLTSSNMYIKKAMRKFKIFRFQLIVAIILLVVGLLYFLLSCKEQPYDPVQNPQNDKNYKKAMSLNSNEPSIK